MQFDPHASLSSSITYENARAKTAEPKKKKEKGIPVDVAKKNAVAVESCDSPDSGIEVEAGIVLKVDSFVSDCDS